MPLRWSRSRRSSLRDVPRRENEKDEAYDRRIRSRYVDVCRFILPAASLANVGMTANGRVIENSIRKWLSSPLAEVREIGETVKEVAQGETPTLVKYAEAVEYLVETGEELSPHPRHSKSWRNGQEGEGDWCDLVDYDKDGENKVLAAALYRFGNMSFADALEKARDDIRTRRSWPKPCWDDLGKYDVPLRELEYCTYTFDLVMDQGAYAEFKRHRMMTQTPQRQTARAGVRDSASYNGSRLRVPV